MTKTINQAYQDALDKFEKRYFTPPQPPNGFHKLLNIHGKEVKGGAFYCKRCKLHVFGPGSTVKHCGKVTKQPGWFTRLFLPKWRIKVTHAD